MDVLVMAHPTSEVIEKLAEKVSHCIERHNVNSSNRARLERLNATYARVNEMLQPVIVFYMPDLDSQQTLRRYETTFTQDLHQLSSCEQTLHDTERPDRELRLQQILAQCEHNVEQFSQFSNFMANQNSSPETTQPSQQEVFTPCIEVPPNPPRLTLDYSTSMTREGRLRAMVLGGMESRIIAVHGARHAGVGKATALRGLAVDQEVVRKFPGGILYIQLEFGQELPESTVVKQIAHLVKRTGGVYTSKMIEAELSLRRASEKACSWFSGHSCLFLVNNIRRLNRSNVDTLTAFGAMVNESSRLVYTTRENHFASQYENVIEFEKFETHSELAQRMLMKHAGFGEDEQLEQRNKVAFEAVLSICQGLPLALGIAGGSVRMNAIEKGLERKQDAWSEFQQDILSTEEDILDSSAEDYGLLSKLIDISLHVLKRANKHDMYSRQFRALCVLEKQQSVPLSALQKLWNLDSMEDVKDVVCNFDEISLVHMVREGGSIAVRVHDLVHEIAVRKASERRESQRFFQDLLRNYRPVVGSRNWWQDEDDGFLYENFCRVLRRAGHQRKLVDLLSQPQWITRRLAKNGISAVELDITHGTLATISVSAGQSTRLEHLQALLVSARFSHRYVVKNPYEVWFQIHGRLQWHATRNWLSKRFVEEIEQCAPRPWAKASLGLLMPADPDVRMLQVPGSVACITLEHDEVWVIWSERQDSLAMGVSCFSTTSGTSTMRRLELDEQQRETVGFLCMAEFLPNGNLVTAHDALKFVIWDRDTAEMKHIVSCTDYSLLGFLRSQWPFRTKEEFIALGAYGTRAASVSETRHSVRIWDTQTGYAVGPMLTGHSDRLLSASFSNNGLLLATSSLDCTVCVWDTSLGAVITRIPGPRFRRVWCVALSGDGCRLATATINGAVHVWDAATGRDLTGEPLRHRGSVKRMKLSADGAHVVLCEMDVTTRVWNVRDGNAQSQQPVWFRDQISCVAVSGDGGRVAAGGWKGVVRVWSTIGRETKWIRTDGNQGWVSSGVLSGDGTRVVSGSSDGTVRVWDARTGELVGPVMDHEGVEVARLAVDARCERIVSQRFLWAGGRRMWDVTRGVCLMTSLDEGWEETLTAMELSWSSTANIQRVAGGALTEEKDGGTVVLATFEQPMWKVAGAHFCYSKNFDTCSIVR